MLRNELRFWAIIATLFQDFWEIAVLQPGVIGTAKNESEGISISARSDGYFYYNAYREVV